jgi:hypothetical protein
MMRKVAVILLGLSLLGALPRVFGQEAEGEPAQVTKTEHVDFGPGGTIVVTGSDGDVNVEGWDKPEVEITVVKTMSYGYKPKQPGEATNRLDGIRVVTERKSSSELAISESRPARGGRWPLPLPGKSRGSVKLEYEIHAPRDTKLVIHVSKGSVMVNDLIGGIEAGSGRGDIVLMLRDIGSYSVDASTKFGIVSSDFSGAARISRYRLGQRYITSNLSSSRQIHLRLSLGGIAIKAIPTEASPAENVKSTRAQ